MAIALVKDLLFATKITSTASALGVPCELVGDPSRMSDAAEAPLLLVDLNLPGAIEAAAAYQARFPATNVVGFVSHTDSATIFAARNAGIHKVLARSAFTEQLPSLLQALES